jgi:hypothetical protein
MDRELVEPRLFVYLASAAPIAAVLSRGPTDWAQLSLWHTDTDRVVPGQWFKGRVYERRSDLSADGSLFAAFVRQSGGREPEGRDTWVAVSRPPYFSALALWFVGGTYASGAFFPAPDTLWTGYQDESPPDRGDLPAWLTIRPARDIAYIDRTAEWPDRTVHFNRLLRDGWALIEREPFQTRWRRRHPREPLTLQMLHAFDDVQRQGGRYRVDYSVWNEDEGRELTLGPATWADWDQRGRLVLARGGQLLTCDLQAGGVEVIADFTNRTPDPQPAPADALQWPRRR